MHNKCGKIKITLKSDICTGSGYSWAGIIDSDSVYDEYGIPYIPSRRLKGCIRENIEKYLDSEYKEKDICLCFGEKGSSFSTGFTLGNAYIENYNIIEQELEGLKGKNFANQQSILERFSRIIGQTKIHKITGIAEESSLRYTRIINKVSPITNSEMVFYADIKYNVDFEKMLSDGIKITRHIGLKRNRGLGNVKMELVYVDDANVIKDSEELLDIEDLKNGKYNIRFALKNIEPLIIGGNDENESMDYVAGQQVLGMLVGKYLRSNYCIDNDVESDLFRDLFLNGKTIFTNLYPYDGERIYYPAPDYLNRLKKSKIYIYNLEDRLPSEKEIEELAGNGDETEKLFWGDGNQPKKLKGKFVSIDKDNNIKHKIYVCEVDKEIIYHHSKRNTHITENGEEGILYTLEAIKKNQMFAGSIIVSESYKDVIVDLLLSGDINLGKSKTTQYGKCKLVKYNGVNNNSKNIRSGDDDYIIVTCLSDLILNNETGQAIVKNDDICEKIAKQMGLNISNEKKYAHSINTGIITGYLGIWNLHKSAIPVIKAGSFFVLKNEGNALPDIRFIGDRNLEGYGQISVDWTRNYVYNAPNGERKKNVLNKNGGIVNSDCLTELLRPIICEMWLTEKISEQLSQKKRSSVFNITNTQASRLIMMLKESKEYADAECKSENYENTKETIMMKNFKKRIDSIKSETTKENAIIFYNVVNDLSDDKKNSDSVLKLNLSYINITNEDDIRQLKEECKYHYAMNILIDRKYNGKDTKGV